MLYLPSKRLAVNVDEVLRRSVGIYQRGDGFVRGIGISFHVRSQIKPVGCSNVAIFGCRDRDGFFFFADRCMGSFFHAERIGKSLICYILKGLQHCSNHSTLRHGYLWFSSQLDSR